MIDPIMPAFIFSVFMSFVIIFQFALALGIPCGEWAMGGKFPGRFPPQMRVVALVQMVFLALVTLIVFTRAGLVLDQYFEPSKYAIWFVVALCVVGTILNLITPSKKERNLWAPVSIVLLVCGVIVARS